MAVILIWRLARDAAGRFFDQVVTGALAAKGGQDAIFLGWIRGLYAGGELFVHERFLLLDLAKIIVGMLVSALIVRLAIAALCLSG